MSTTRMTSDNHLVISNSGCQLSIGDTVIKSSNHNRLSRQVRKQKNFRNKFPNLKIKTPNIISEKYSVEMEYIEGYTGVELLLNKDFDKLDWLISELCKFISRNIVYNYSSSKSGLVEKINNIEDSTGISLDRAFLNKFSDIFSVPYGYYHGDLTLSNVIVQDDSIYLIDFIDTYPDSPIWDICKLRQDLVYGWSHFKTNTDFVKLDSNKHIDKLISDYKLNEIIPLFDYMTLARILPYADKSETDFILGKLKECSTQTLLN